MNQDKLKNLKELLQLANKDYASVGDVAKIVVEVGKILKEHKESIDKSLLDSLKKMSSDLQGVIDAFKSEKSSLENKVKDSVSLSTEVKSAFNSLKDELESKLVDVESKIPRQTDLTPLQRRIEEVESKIPEIPEVVLDSPQEVRNKLESLKGNDRLDKSSIRGLEELEREIQVTKSNFASRLIGGLQGLFTYVDGAKKGILKSVDFVGGSGMTITHSKVNGQDTLTFVSSPGSGSSTSLSVTPSGTVDGSNTVFTIPVQASSLAVYADGARALPTSDYSFVVGVGITTITFVSGRQPFNSILVDYTV